MAKMLNKKLLSNIEQHSIVPKLLSHSVHFPLSPDRVSHWLLFITRRPPRAGRES